MNNLMNGMGEPIFEQSHNYIVVEKISLEAG